MINKLIIDDKQIDTQIAENTVLVQELGHYMAGAYYRTYFEIILKKLIDTKKLTLFAHF